MADRTVTVKSSGGTYTTLASALSTESIDLVTNTRILTVECYASASNDNTVADTGTGYTSNSSYYIKITCPSTERHAGFFDTANAYYMNVASSSTPALQIRTDYTRVEWLCITVDDYHPIRINASFTEQRISNCILTTTTPTTGNYGIRIGNTFTGTLIAWNNIIYGLGSTSVGIGGDQTTSGTIIKAYNNTIAGGTGAYGVTSGLSLSSNSNNVSRNNIFAYLVGSEIFGIPAGGDHDYNVSTYPYLGYSYIGGPHDRFNQNIDFVNEASNPPDFRLRPTDTGALGQGEVRPAFGFFNESVRGNTRGDSWDCGADQCSYRTVTVKGSGGNYTTLASALSTESANLITAKYNLLIECYASASNDSTAADTGTGYTADIGNCIYINVPLSERHAGVWDSTKYYRSGSNPQIRIQENYTRVSGIQMELAGASITNTYLCRADSYCKLEEMIIKSTATSTSGNAAFYSGNANLTVWNSLVYGFNYAHYNSDSFTAQLINCTLVDCNYGLFLPGDGNTNCYNVGFSNVTTQYTGGIPGLTTCSTTTPTFVDSANKNYNLSPDDTTWRAQGTELFYGSVLSNRFRNDITRSKQGRWVIWQTSRDGMSYDIGAFEAKFPYFIQNIPAGRTYPSTGNSTSSSFQENISSGSVLVAVVLWTPDTEVYSTPVCSDNQNGSWTLIKTNQNSDASGTGMSSKYTGIAFFYCPSPSAGNKPTVTALVGTPSDIVLKIFEVGNVYTSRPLAGGAVPSANIQYSINGPTADVVYTNYCIPYSYNSLLLGACINLSSKNKTGNQMLTFGESPLSFAGLEDTWNVNCHIAYTIDKSKRTARRATWTSGGGTQAYMSNFIMIRANGATGRPEVFPMPIEFLDA